MKAISTAVLSTLVALNLLPTGAIANPARPTLQPRPGTVSTTPILKPLQIATVSGKITNGGSNNGGQPSFNCNQIKLYAALQTVPTPSGDEIVIPTYKQVGGLATISGGSAAAGCTYSLNLSGQALKQSVHLIAIAPDAWSTPINVVNLAPSSWMNPLQVTTGQTIQGKDFQIRATLIK